MGERPVRIGEVEGSTPSRSTMLKTKRDKGKKGEKIVADFLREKGYKILERNYFPQVKGPLVGEIDIIAKDKEEIVFVEVKSSFKEGSIPPEERFHLKK